MINPLDNKVEYKGYLTKFVEEIHMKKLQVLLFVLGVTFAISSNADMCPAFDYKLYSPVSGDGALVNGAWVANRLADEA